MAGLRDWLISWTACLLLVLGLGAGAARGENAVVDPAALVGHPDDYRGARVEYGTATLSAAERWAFLRTKQEHGNFHLRATVTIEQAATQFGFFGQSWSVWPDKAFGDQGFEAGLLLRGGDGSGYRVQVSHKYQCLALVKFPEGGYLQVVPCDVQLNQPQVIAVSVQGNEIAVELNSEPKIRYVDRVLPLSKGRWGIGTSSRAKVAFRDVTFTPLEPKAISAAAPEHVPTFAVRNWLGGRPWVFDGDEPVLLLPTPQERYINNVKLRPGYKPLLSWNSHWGIENQGAYPEGENRNSEIAVTGGGKTLVVRWTGRHVKDRFETRTAMTIGYDRQRRVYTYAVDSELEVLPGEPFHFRYGFDFEHHTPLDPFGWQYLVVRRDGGKLNYRPLSPFDPGPMDDVELYNGLRLWHGRSSGTHLVSPAVEYEIDPSWNLVAAKQKVDEKTPRQCNTAVCAAFYDTGVSYAPETTPAGAKVRVKYRYTGYPADEAKFLFEAATVHDNPRNDPEHHFLFAGDEWPQVTFGRALAMDKPWWGGRPFLSGHNARPSYDLAKTPGIGNGSAMKLGPQSYGVASLAAPSPLPKGRYIVSATVKSENTHGPGGRIEVLATARPEENNYLRHSANILREETHFLGNGSFDWKTVRFVTEVPSEAPALALGLGNAGTGAVYVADVSFQPLAENDPIPDGVLPHAQTQPPPINAAPAGALFDFRMQELTGYYVYNYGTNAYRTLELANIDWTTDEGRPALRFADNPPDRHDYPKLGSLDNNVRHPVYGPTYEKVKHVAAAIAGHHGGGFEVKELTLAAWIKPAAETAGRGYGDILGVGARRFILSLYGHKPPYRLGARLNVNDRFVASTGEIEAEQWCHAAMTCTTTPAGKWHVRLYINGEQVHEGTTETFTAPASIPPSVILGAELFYLHDAYYRGLIGRTLVFDRVLSAKEIAALVQENFE